ncbi:MAG: hypothetical protein M3024_13040 [Candidatus Dormibacteraeota bacterium]|nr:hypothetical protein [Candidatus Dormibacteraeota bacterium]
MRIRVIPHFMRLHEWIALEEGYFREQGLETDLLSDVMHGVSGHRESAYLHRPQDRPFLAGDQVANSACEWGSVCNAGAGMGRFVPDLYGVARHALFVGNGSNIDRLSDLADVPVGVGLMAGSHFTALRTLETVLPPARVKVANIGGPGRRLEALVQGEVEVANLLDPEIPIAQAWGLRQIAAGEFRTLFWVSRELDQGALEVYFRALRSADSALRREPARYMHLWARNVPPGLAGDHEFSTFGRGELLVFEPYPEQAFADAIAFARRWDLDGDVREERFEALAAHVAIH